MPTAICHSTWHKRKPKSAAPKRKRGKKKPRRSRGVRPSAAPAEDSLVDALGPDVGSDEGGSSEADESASLVQQFTFHKGEKVCVWWESVGVWLIGEIDRVMDKSVEVHYEASESESDFFAAHLLRTSKIEKVVEK